MTISAFKLFIVSTVRRERDDNSQSRMQLIRDYIDNTEE